MGQTGRSPLSAGNWPVLCLVFIAIVGLALYFGIAFMKSTQFELVATIVSPDGSYSLQHCRSRDDLHETHHAPYGDHVFLRRYSSKRKSCEGDLVFAGYCRVLDVTWQNQSSIQLRCRESESVVSLMDSIRGVGVHLETDERRAER